MENYPRSLDSAALREIRKEYWARKAMLDRREIIDCLKEISPIHRDIAETIDPPRWPVRSCA